MQIVLYGFVLLVFVGGLVLIFARDWVWSIDSRAEAHERDADGNPIRTEKWDRAHRIQGIVMVVIAIMLAGLVYRFV